MHACWININLNKYFNKSLSIQIVRVVTFCPRTTVEKLPYIYYIFIFNLFENLNESKLLFVSAIHIKYFFEIMDHWKSREDYML